MKNNNNLPYGWMAVVVSLVFFASAALSLWVNILNLHDRTKAQ